MTREQYWYWICNIEGVWHKTVEKLLKYFVTPEALFTEPAKNLERIIEESDIKDKGILINIINSRNEDKIIKSYESLDKNNIEFISIENENYPEQYRVIREKPYGIYVKAYDINNKYHLFSEQKSAIAIVGARNCTIYGKKVASDIGFELAVNGVNTISGLAKGIDAAGHWGTIDAGGRTCAVMGCGVDICYPRENIELYERIMDRGIIVSDYQLGAKPLSWQFPLRNRLISALSDKVLVVEAREKSGSLITVEYALEQGKDIFAVPGRVGDSLSSGCNRLIKEGAGIALSAREILDDIGIVSGENTKKKAKTNIMLEKEIEMLYSCVDFFPKNIQQLMEETGKDSVEILRGLVKLQMMNLIDEPSKNYYSRKI